MRSQILFIVVLLGLVTAACSSSVDSGFTVEKASDSPSATWESIETLLAKQCDAKIKENFETLSSLYPYDPATKEYKDFKRLAMKNFQNIATVDCTYDLQEIRISDDGMTVYAAGQIRQQDMERATGFPLDPINVAFPAEGQEDSFKFEQINGDWQFCPGDCMDTTVLEKISCPTGEVVTNKEDCSAQFRTLFVNFNATQCLEEDVILPYVLPAAIGDFKVQPGTLVNKHNNTKLFKPTPTRADRFPYNSDFEVDYQHEERTERIMNIWYLELAEDADYARYETFIDEVQANTDVPDGVTGRVERETKNIAGFETDVVSLVTDFADLDPQRRVSTVAYRFFVHVPSHNAVLEFKFNGFITREYAENLIYSYMSRLCAIKDLTYESP